MATSLKQAFSGGGGIIQLQPDLTGSGQGVVDITATGVEQVALSLSGRYAVSVLQLETGTVDPCTIVMIVDGVTILNTTVTASSNTNDIYSIYGSDALSLSTGLPVSNGQGDSIPFLVENSLEIRVTRAASATPIRLGYILRAIK